MNSNLSQRFWMFSVLAFAAMGTGCSTIDVGQLGNRRYYESREVPQDRRTVLNTCRQALETMGFVLESGSPAAGRIEMAARVQPGSSAVLVRQRRVIVGSDVGPEGGAVVQVGFWEISEDTSSAETVTATGRLLKGGGLYDVFWKRVDELVAAGSPGGPPAAAPPGG